MKHRQGAIRVAHHRAFGNLEYQLVARDDIALQQLPDPLFQSQAGEVFGGDVQRHFHVQAATVPEMQLPQHRLDHPGGQQLDAASALSQWNEFAGRHHAVDRVIPAQQRLGLINPTVLQIDLRLKMQVQAAGLGGVAQVTNEGDLPLMGIVTAVLIELQAVRQLRGVLHGDPCAAQQFVDAAGIVRVTGHADVRLDAHLQLGDAYRQGQRLLDRHRGAEGVVRRGITDDQQEFVA